MKEFGEKALVVAGLLAVTAASAFCQGTIYTSRPAFEAALSSSTTITFEDLPPNNQPLGESSITSSGVTFSNPGALLFITDPGGLYPVPGTGRYLCHFDGGYPVDILLPGGVTAFGADFSGGIAPSLSLNATLTVNLTDGASYVYNFSGPLNSWTFFGVSFPQSIFNLVYRDAGPPDGGLGGPLHEEKLDNVTFGPIPEPSGLGLFAPGGLLLGGQWWRKVGK